MELARSQRSGVSHREIVRIFFKPLGLGTRHYIVQLS